MLKLRLIQDAYLDSPLGQPIFGAAARRADMTQEEYDAAEEYGYGIYYLEWAVPEGNVDFDDESCMIDCWESPDRVIGFDGREIDRELFPGKFYARIYNR